MASQVGGQPISGGGATSGGGGISDTGAQVAGGQSDPVDDFTLLHEKTILEDLRQITTPLRIPHYTSAGYPRGWLTIGGDHGLPAIVKDIFKEYARVTGRFCVKMSHLVHAVGGGTKEGVQETVRQVLEYAPAAKLAVHYDLFREDLDQLPGSVTLNDLKVPQNNQENISTLVNVFKERCAALRTLLDRADFAQVKLDAIIVEQETYRVRHIMNRFLHDDEQVTEEYQQAWLEAVTPHLLDVRQAILHGFREQVNGRRVVRTIWYEGGNPFELPLIVPMEYCTHPLYYPNRPDKQRQQMEFLIDCATGQFDLSGLRKVIVSGGLPGRASYTVPQMYPIMPYLSLGLDCCDLAEGELPHMEFDTSQTADSGRMIGEAFKNGLTDKTHPKVEGVIFYPQINLPNYASPDAPCHVYKWFKHFFAYVEGFNEGAGGAEVKKPVPERELGI